jgi:hypothetical protein
MILTAILKRRLGFTLTKEIRSKHLSAFSGSESIRLEVLFFTAF